jgi:hypothetical protein
MVRGREFPSCAFAGPGNSARNDGASAPSDCPPQYTRFTETESGRVLTCDYTGVISTSINGQLFTRTWWSLTGGTVTEFSATAKSQLGRWNTRFDDDYAAWLAAQPAPTPPPVEGGT